MPDESAYQLVRDVLATSDTFLRESQRLFRPHGLTAAQYNVLSVLAAADTGLSQRELGDVLVVDRSNVTGLLDRLQKAGWVQRGDDPKDRRIYRVSLTPAGRRLWKKVNPLFGEVVEQVVRRLTEKQTRETLATLQALREGAVAWRLPGL